MELLLKVLASAVLGYLLGSVNSSLVVGKFYGIDVRKYGSGNAGATNTLRTIGKTATVFVTIGDILKGVIACVIGYYLVGNVEGVGYLGVMAGGLFSVMGHNWPVFFQFKGGKGALTSLAVALMMDWKVALLMLVIFLIVATTTRYVSLGSIVGAVAYPIISAIPYFQKSLTFVFFAAALGALILFRHKSNITRMLKGTELKLGEKYKIER